MTIPFTQPTLTGYNSSPPPDDDSAVAANAVSWAKHVDKLGDPLKNFATAISDNVYAAFGKLWLNGVSTKSSPYTVAASDRGKLFSVSGTTTLTLLASATAGDGFALGVLNTGTATVTIDGNASETINGSTTVTLGPGAAMELVSDGANWVGVVANPRNTLAKTTTYPVVATDHGSTIIADATSAGFTITLPAVATAKAGFQITVIKVDTTANIVTIDGATSETINGVTSWLLSSQDDVVTLTCDGSEWHVTGRFNHGAPTKTTTYTVVESDHGKTILCDASGGAFTVTLPTVASAGRGFHVRIVKDESSVNAVTIDGATSETINGATTALLRNLYDSADLICDGSEWLDLNERLRSTTLQATTACASGTSASITGIPDGVTEVVVPFNGLSLSGATDRIIFRLGDSGGLQATGYDANNTNASGSSISNESTGFFLSAAATSAGVTFGGQFICTLLDPTNNIWAVSGQARDAGATDTRNYVGTVTLDGPLDRVGFAVSGSPTDAFDGSGVFNVRWS